MIVLSLRPLLDVALALVTQFGSKGYGFILGNAGEQYFAHQKNIVNNSRLKVNMSAHPR
jgi:hypothetical protein